MTDHVRDIESVRNLHKALETHNSCLGTIVKLFTYASVKYSIENRGLDVSVIQQSIIIMSEKSINKVEQFIEIVPMSNDALFTVMINSVKCNNIKAFWAAKGRYTGSEDALRQAFYQTILDDAGTDISVESFIKQIGVNMLFKHAVKTNNIDYVKFFLEKKPTNFNKVYSSVAGTEMRKLLDAYKDGWGDDEEFPDVKNRILRLYVPKVYIDTPVIDYLKNFQHTSALDLFDKHHSQIMLTILILLDAKSHPYPSYQLAKHLIEFSS